MPIPAPSQIAAVGATAPAPLITAWMPDPSIALAASAVVAPPPVLAMWPASATAPSGFAPVAAPPPTLGAASFTSVGAGAADNRFVFVVDAQLRDIVTIQAGMIQ